MNTQNISKLVTVVSTLFVLTSLGVTSSKADGITPTPRSVDDHAEMKMHLGVLLGVADPIGSAKAAFNYGLDFGMQPYVPFSVGLQITRFSSGDSSLTTGSNISRTSVLAKGAYNFGGDICILRSSYIGFKLGPVFEEYRGNSRTRFGIAPMVGFDESIAVDWSVGVEAAYLGVVGPDSADSLSLNGAIKYWF